MKKIKKLIEILKNGKKNICYGAGNYGKQILCFARSHGFDIEYFVTSESNNRDKIFGIQVVNINNITNKDEYNWIIGVSERYVKEILFILTRKGIKPDFIADSKFISNIIKDALLTNKKIHNIVPSEKRCFIMGTGGTLNFLDTSLLQNEDVFSCSYCSLLDNYRKINPKYYVLPALTNDWVSTDEYRDVYIREKISFFSKTIISPLVFCDYNDRGYLQFYEGFQGKEVFYLQQTGIWEQRTTIYDLCKKTPVIQTGTIMMLKIAMYMGYKEIYLIGTEHDLVGHKYGHAYDLKKMGEWGYDDLLKIAISQNKNVNNWSNREKLRISLNMYNEYYYLHNIAKQNEIKIFNATEGGSLDEFERVDYQSLF